MKFKNYIYAIYYIISKMYMRFFYPNLKAGKGVLFKGIPSVHIGRNTNISIGDNTTINSSNWNYHINMFNPCKLFTDRDNASIRIGKNCRIHGTCIHAYKSISIGDNCLIAANTQIIDANGHELSFDKPSDRIKTADEGKPIIIKDNVWIAANCIILGGTTIGDGSVITANSVVKGYVPDRCLYGGNPAKLIKQY